MRREEVPVDTALFRREWNLALALVASAAVFLLAAGHTVAGVIVVGLGAAAFVARWSAMRKANRGFYGQDERPAK